MWPDRQRNHTAEHDVRKHVEHPTDDYDDEAEDSHSQRWAGRSAQDGEHVDDCVWEVNSSQVI